MAITTIFLWPHWHLFNCAVIFTCAPTAAHQHTIIGLLFAVFFGKLPAQHHFFAFSGLFCCCCYQLATTLRQLSGCSHCSISGQASQSRFCCPGLFFASLPIGCHAGTSIMAANSGNGPDFIFGKFLPPWDKSNQKVLAALKCPKCQAPPQTCVRAENYGAAIW